MRRTWLIRFPRNFSVCESFSSDLRQRDQEAVRVVQRVLFCPAIVVPEDLLIDIVSLARAIENIEEFASHAFCTIDPEVNSFCVRGCFHEQHQAGLPLVREVPASAVRGPQP